MDRVFGHATAKGRNRPSVRRFEAAETCPKVKAWRLAYPTGQF